MLEQGRLPRLLLPACHDPTERDAVPQVDTDLRDSAIGGNGVGQAEVPQDVEHLLIAEEDVTDQPSYSAPSSAAHKRLQHEGSKPVALKLVGDGQRDLRPAGAKWMRRAERDDLALGRHDDGVERSFGVVQR